MASIERDAIGSVLPAMVSQWPTEADRDPWDDEGPWDTLETGKQWFVAGSPPLVLVATGSPHDVTVAIPVISWPHPHRTSLGAESAVSFSLERDGTLAEWLTREVDRATATRLASFTACGECDTVVPPEGMHNRTICHGCAERNHGVLH